MILVRLFLMVFLYVGLVAPAARPAMADISLNRWDPWDLCARHVSEAERLMRVPLHLMQAISKVESGRWNRDRKALFAWPWTVMAEGRGRYLPNRRSAIAEVRRLQARGVRNIDVGCMQINLYWHPDAFDNLEQAFDPAYNVAYAAVFLQELRGETRNWPDAVGRYHSMTPERMRAYRQKVLRRWQEEKREARRAVQTARSQAALPAQESGAGANSGG